MENSGRPKVGVGYMIFKEGKVLVGRRAAGATHGAGHFAFPGGHFEYMETFEESIRRELAEECGIEIQNIRFQFVANLRQFAPHHYVHLGFVADWKSGEPQLLEPEKSEAWRWYSMDEIPDPVSPLAVMAIESFKSGRTFFEA